MVFCPNCGKEVKEGVKFCTECGARVEEQGMPVPTQVPTQPTTPTPPTPPVAPTPSVTSTPPVPLPVSAPQPAPPTPPKPFYPPTKRSKIGIAIGVVAIVIVLILSAVLVGFQWKNGEEEEGGTEVGGTEDIIINTDSYISVASQSVNLSGGIIEVVDNSNPLYGLKIGIPEGATNDEVNLSISYANVSSISGLPETASVVSKMIHIETDGSEVWDKYKTFDKAIEVTLPYDPSLVSADEAMRFYYYDEENNALDSAGFLSQNSTGHTITFYTRTFSKFIAIKIVLAVSEFLGENFSVDTGFRPVTDGWFITNYGSYLESGGLCMGMVSFAKYYYTYKKSSTGVGLYEKYREGDLNKWRDDDTAIQLATRAHIAESDIWDQTWRHEIVNQTPTSTDVACSWLHGIIVTGSPQLIGIYQQVASGEWVGGHAILVYGYTNGRFDIYDPNYPGTASGTDARQIPFTYGTGFTRVYSSGATAGSGRFQYNVFLHWGYKAFHPLNAFNQLYTHAENGFKDDTIFPTVTLTDSSTTPVGTTPEDIDDDGIRDTTENKIIISGTISGGKKEVNSTLLFISNQKFKVTVVDGSFSQEIPLYQGDNDLIILATDENTFSNWAGYLRDTIKSTASKASLTFTLTWGQDQSDVDLHVLEPTIEDTEGRHIYYSNKGYQGSGNPYLDIDNTWGYGPEHYYATEDMTLPNYSGANNSLYGTYKFRVHYFADHDDDDENTQPITWHVTVRYLAYKDEVSGIEFWNENAWSGASTVESRADTDNFDNSGASWSSTFVVEYLQPDPEDYGTPLPPQNELP